MGSFEDGAQLTGFVVQAVQLGTGPNLAFDQDQQPVLGFIGFLNRDAQFGDELCPGAGTAPRVIIGGNAAIGLGELSDDFESYRIAWQCSQEPAEADRESPGTIPQFLRSLVHALVGSTPRSIVKSPKNQRVAAMSDRNAMWNRQEIRQIQQSPNPNPQILKS